MLLRFDNSQRVWGQNHIVWGRSQEQIRLCFCLKDVTWVFISKMALSDSIRLIDQFVDIVGIESPGLQVPPHCPRTELFMADTPWRWNDSLHKYLYKRKAENVQQNSCSLVDIWMEMTCRRICNEQWKWELDKKYWLYIYMWPQPHGHIGARLVGSNHILAW